MKRGEDILDLIVRASMYLELHEFLVTADECKLISEAFIDFICISDHM